MRSLGVSSYVIIRIAGQELGSARSLGQGTRTQKQVVYTRMTEASMEYSSEHKRYILVRVILTVVDMGPPVRSYIAIGRA